MPSMREPFHVRQHYQKHSGDVGASVREIRQMMIAQSLQRNAPPDDYRLNDDGPSERFRSVRAVPGEHWDWICFHSWEWASTILANRWQQKNYTTFLYDRILNPKRWLKSQDEYAAARLD
jgi:hypothetical protein